MDGILLLDKPEGWTSFDVVAKIRGVIKRETGQKKPKIGHTGTLDPLATGLLVLLLGNYTKRASDYSKLDKTYEVSMLLGKNSSTGDREGELTRISDNKPTEEQVHEVLQQFIGAIQQIPPAYSAIKVAGKRAYQLARAGKTVELEPRTVTIYSISQTTYDYPIVKFKAHVSSGTYIRSLAQDIGEMLETGAYLKNLRRTEVGEYTLEKALTIDQLKAENILVNLNK